MNTCRRRLLAASLTWMICCVASRAAEPASVEFVPPNSAEPWVGQGVSFAVDVVVEGRFSGSTLFDLPQVPHAILMKPDERPVLSTRTEDERELTVQRHEFALFCQSAGTITVPAIGVRLGAVKSFGEPSQEYTLTVPGFTVNARLPEGAKPDQVVVSTADLEITEQWDPRPAKAKVGDAFRRTITMRASNVPGMMLPETPTPELAGVAVYPDQPVVSDQTERGDLVGQRVDSLTYVCEAAGSVVIPGVQVRWWNPSESTWGEHLLPEVKLDVAVNPAYGDTTPGDAVSPEVSDATNRPWRWLAPIAAVVAVALLVRYRPRADLKKEAFRKLLKACRANDATAAYNAFTEWRAVAVDSSAQLPEEVRTESQRVQRVIVGQETSWQGAGFATALRSWHTQLRHAGRHPTAAAVLPPMNPRDD